MRTHSTTEPAEDGPTLFVPKLAAFYAAAQPIMYALLRVAFGLILLTHGIPKALGIPHGSIADPMAGTRNMIANVLHLPFPDAMAAAAMLLETVGAFAIALGLMTRFFAAAFVVEMGVICFAHGPAFSWIDRGFEYPLTLGLLALHFAVSGGGRYSLDQRLPKQL